MSIFHDATEQSVTRSGARRMRTSVTYNADTGAVTATTRTWNAVKFTGFTGGVSVVIYSHNGEILAHTPIQTFGVDGTWVGRADRTDIWSASVPNRPDPSQVAGIKAVHTHAGRNRLNDILTQAEQMAERIAQFIRRLDGLKPA